ncbi:MAG: PA2169 family four-helix-bundle protein [Terracidiphilus sp.]
MAHPSEELKETESTLRTVIDVLIDCQEGFQKIGDQLKDETLKRYFLAESLKRAQFRGDLETVLHQEGIHDVKESGTVAGTVHRAWADIKAILGGGDHTLLETAEKGEEAARTAYSDALKQYLPQPVRQLLSTQAAHIQTSHEYVKTARDSLK